MAQPLHRQLTRYGFRGCETWMGWNAPGFPILPHLLRWSAFAIAYYGFIPFALNLQQPRKSL